MMATIVEDERAVIYLAGIFARTGDTIPGRESVMPVLWHNMINVDTKATMNRSTVVPLIIASLWEKK